MAAKKTTPATDKPARKPRTPKPVTDLPTAAAAYKKALTAHTRAYGVLLDATEAEKAAAAAKADAKAVMDRFYREMVEGDEPGQDAPEAAPVTVEQDYDETDA